MADNKTVKFGADVTGLKSAMRDASKETKAYYDEQLTNASKLSNSTAQQTNFIRLQTKAIQDNIKAEREKQETLIATFNIEKARIENQRKAGAIDRETAAQQIKAADKTLGQQIKQGDLKIQGLDKVVEGLKGVRDEISLSAMKEIASDKKGVLEQIKAFDKVSAAGPGKLYEKYTPEQVMKLQTQKEMLRGDSQAQQQQSMFGAILGAEAVKGVLSKISQVGGAMAGAQSGEQFLADALKGIPIFGEMIGGAVGRSQEESYQAQTGANRFRGRAGKGGMFSASNLGYSIAETMPLAEQVVTALGTSQDFKSRTKDVMGAERAFSLDRGTLTEMLKQQRMQDSGDLGKNVSVVYNTMKEKGFIKEGDTTQFQEILQLQNSLLAKQSEVMETTDPQVATGIISAFKTVGGSFGDARAAGRIAQISGALAGPGNDFQKARNMQVLSKIKPGASLFETMEMQEKGIAQEGFLAETLKQLEKETGGGEGMMLATKARLGLGAGATRQLVEQFQGDRSMFDEFGGSKAELEERLNLQQMGGKLTANRDKEQARISDAFVKGAIPGMKQVGIEFGRDVGKMLKESGLPLGEEIGQGIINSLNGTSSNTATTSTGNATLDGMKVAMNLLKEE